jgi:hypothetical protein
LPDCCKSIEKRSPLRFLYDLILTAFDSQLKSSALSVPNMTFWTSNTIFFAYFHHESRLGVGAFPQTGFTSMQAGCTFEPASEERNQCL